jgi:hypothetical protein
MEAGTTVNALKLPLILLAAALLFAGCRSPDIYYWGNYEKVVYGIYAHPDKFLPEVQVQKMEEDMHKAVSANKPLPPGFHAHLGYAYFQLGKFDLAHQEFENEKKQFPESAVFMDRLLGNLEKK